MNEPRQPKPDRADLRSITFYRSALLPCPYLAGRYERRFVAELTPTLVEERLFDQLTASGFRRSHNLIYRPACPECHACVPVRVAVERFAPRRTLKRTWRDNADLKAAIVGPKANAEQYALFHRYQLSRHGDGDMAEMDFLDFQGLIEDSAADTRLLELRLPDDTLIGCCLFDVTADGFSAVYSFYDAELAADRSLGSYLVLWLIEHARETGRPFVYLGYWIEECRKMAYKVRFQPIEALGPTGWTPLKEQPAADK